MRTRSFAAPNPVDLSLTLGPLQHGRADPCTRIGPTEAWRATRTPHGPATEHLVARGRRIEARAWGPGAEWILDRAPALVGAGDDVAGFTPRHGIVRDLFRRLRGLRLGQTDAVLEVLVPTILEQKVTGKQARRSWRALVVRHGEPAPGPGSLRLPPSPETLAGVPSYELHPLGVERRRAEVVRRVAAAAAKLEEATGMALPDAYRRLRAVPGVGPWTAAQVAMVALGDPDAVVTDDFHLPHLVSWLLAGEPRGSDARMLELLEPYRGHRSRVIRLLVAGGPRPPSFAPRRALVPIERF